MRRIVVLLTVVAMMVGMLAMSVAPAFAAWDAQGGQCRTGDTLIGTNGVPRLIEKDRNGDQQLCLTHRGPAGVNLSFYDNRLI
jgi:hypothetical protein